MPILAGLMATQIHTVPHTLTVREAAKLMRNLKVGSLLVDEDGQHVGVLTERDLTWKVLAEPVDPDIETVSHCMSSPIITMDVNASPEQAECSWQSVGSGTSRSPGKTRLSGSSPSETCSSIRYRLEQLALE